MPDGTQRVWDSVKWRAAGLAPGPYLPLSGGSLTGPLALAADPTSAMQAATKEYVDAEALNNTGRNLVHNGTFVVAQRGTGSIAGVVGAVTYTADRWFIVPGASGDTMTAQILAHTDANRAAIGDEAAEWFVTVGVTGGTGASNICNFATRIEDVKRLSGKTVTVSFWCNTTSGQRVGIGLAQLFGSGGSPSAPVFVPGQIITTTATLTRYSATFVVPSAAGKTFGTSGGDCTQLAFTLSNGGVSGYPAVGAQSATFNFWGAQLEVGSVATPLAKRDPADELALCQRFYFTSAEVGINNWAGAAGQQYSTSLLFPVTMRATPTITVAVGGSTNVSGVPTSPYATSTSVKLQVTNNAIGMIYWDGSFTASADL